MLQKVQRRSRLKSENRMLQVPIENGTLCFEWISCLQYKEKLNELNEGFITEVECLSLDQSLVSPVIWKCPAPPCRGGLVFRQNETFLIVFPARFCAYELLSVEDWKTSSIWTLYYDSGNTLTSGCNKPTRDWGKERAMSRGSCASLTSSQTLN
jgi:hypothetical protein